MGMSKTKGALPEDLDLTEAEAQEALAYELKEKFEDDLEPATAEAFPEIPVMTPAQEPFNDTGEVAKNASITAGMYDWAKSWPEKVIDHISPSMLGRCMRAHYYAIRHVPQTTPPGPGALLNFELGRMWEEQVTKGLRHARIPFLEQYKMYDEHLNMEGTLDFLVLEDIKKQEWAIIDSKTESVYSAGYRRKGRESFMQSHPEYVVQLAAYKLMLERQGFLVPRGKFVVITKDNGKLDEFPLVFSEEVMDKVKRRIIRLKEALILKRVPDCECEGWIKGYCNYGNPNTQIPNSKKKMVNTSCCGTIEEMSLWRTGLL